MEQGTGELPLVGIAVGVLLALVVLLVLAKALGGRRGPATKVDKKVRELMNAGHFDAAANRALELKDLESAYELFLRAQSLEKAAKVAQQLGRLNVAAELYEKSGDLPKAAQMYRQAGMAHKARECEQAMLPQSETGAAVLGFGGASAPSATPAGGGGGSGTASAPEKKPNTAADRARQLEESFRAMQRALEPGDAEAESRVQRFAEQAAEAWMTAGDLKRAADVYRDAGLVDQAMNLYVNALGEPGTAAVMCADRGDHKRAAELFEAAGQKERSLAAWVSWSTGAEDPLAHVRDVSRLGVEALTSLVLGVVESRPLSGQNVELHYRAGRVLEQANQGALAIPVFERINALDARYRDVGQRLGTLRSAGGAPPVVVVAPPAPAPPAPAPFDPSLPASAPPTKQSEGAVAAANPRAQEMDRMVAEAAVRAADIVHQRASAPGTAVPSTAVSPVGKPPPVQRIEVSVVHTNDPAIKEAHKGPSPDQLRAMIAGREPDLSNIEVYYRLGLALTARGEWDAAKAAFGAVEEVSPGYRDAWKRIEEVDELKKKVAASSGASAVGAPPAASPASTVTGAPKQPDRYEILGELGRGGMAVVFRAKDEALGREVALKFLTEEAGDSVVFMNFFKREARAAAALNHPNIVTIYDVGVHDGRPFIAMELVQGTSIEAVLEKEGKLELAEALRVIDNVLVALDYAHGKKIVHRDVKPANIMRTTQGLVKLMDFGLAKSIEGGNKTTMISGTPSYMAPEQLMGKDIDMRSDVFAVGASLYELVTGVLPFQSMVRMGPPPPMKTHVPDVPDALQGIVDKAIAFERDQRYAGAAEMLVEIRALASTLKAPAAPPKPLPRVRMGTMVGVAPPSAVVPQGTPAAAAARPAAPPAQRPPLPATASPDAKTAPPPSPATPAPPGEGVPAAPPAVAPPLPPVPQGRALRGTMLGVAPTGVLGPKTREGGGS